MATKLCTKCKNECDLSSFCKQKTSKDGLGCYCWDCRRNYRETYIPKKFISIDSKGFSLDSPTIEHLSDTINAIVAHYSGPLIAEAISKQFECQRNAFQETITNLIIQKQELEQELENLQAQKINVICQIADINNASAYIRAFKVFPKTKICCRCLTQKSIAEFNKDSKKSDFKKGHCKECQSKIYKENSERHIAYVYDWQKRNPEKFKAIVKKYQKKMAKLSKKMVDK